MKWRRAMAATSSMVIAVSTTPWPAQALASTSQSGENGLLSGSPPRTTPGITNRILRSNGRIHYAVATRRIVPIYQSPTAGHQFLLTLLARKRSRTTGTLNVQTQRTTSERSSSIPHVETTTIASRPSSVSAAATTSVATASLGLKIASLALSFVGSAYVWGGASPGGFDCSGLTSYVYAQFGVHIPRTSYEQFDAGEAVSYADLEPGDLVFFDTDGTGASHVAIYIGNGMMVQALNESTGVVVGRLSDPYFAARYLGARRYTSV